ncbi:DNA repair protein Pso2/Snm1, putative [Talaromyces stipitatus ATCC 10500]|uniref:DNA repair protein Pso2/Snm1, putative n=1 Tax=Talaromyces stipitatus (strain ATCC 10500 / CBS 375.48 / QM 6759 / NRRL 1006) TaxID=441959 RepID=B8MMA3_TALSN|nr:DNA repair protein Pso2/Snm1, putative [Talaromyces stipitatus ATCC 10500]EED13657.1 DNA repair protein Pso2/Snm1, putative [Talaromyces stipitatus ATCC 10500]
MAGTAVKKSTTTPASKRTPSFQTPKRGSSAVKKNGNTSILNFFKKADGPPQSQLKQPRLTQFGVTISRFDVAGNGRKSALVKGDSAGEGLFVEDMNRSWKKLVDIRDDTRTKKTSSPTDVPEASSIPAAEPKSEDTESKRFNESFSSVKRRKVNSLVVKGPFIDESDSEDEEEYTPFTDTDKSNHVQSSESSIERPPPLVRAATSNFETSAVADDFDDIEDDIEGDEFLGKAWMQDETSAFGISEGDPMDDGPSCPICQASLAGQSHADASLHVNACLDTNQQPLSPKKERTPSGLTRQEKAAIARPAQQNPFAEKSTGSTSAFAKLMAGNAEDSAWATAAANEVASRGKQAYERTCPFYKILPGFSITVDAFRYGSVEGCQAYFLSHFHSDHYGGLTASWSHGLIYCSKVTGNLVRQQLKVDPKYVVDLEFEKKTEVPNTKGVYVTMLYANHCPGSSLFLFEKVMDTGRIHRVLHCGDFRACPAHVQHPLLKPDVVDVASGQSHQQRIDVCYLDTTYLNPKYAFPNQEDVITACADMCVRLSDEQGDRNEALEFHKRGKMDAMANFLSTTKGKDFTPSSFTSDSSRGRLLVVIGTYSIGKERICLGIARALKCKIYAPPQKQRVCACLEDPELSSLLTDNPLEAQIHMQILFEIRAETLSDYLQSFKGHFSRVVGFRPTGWTYRPPGGRLLDNPPVANVLYSSNWKTPFSVSDLVPQRGSTKESSCFGVPYSEHSSFRELTMFCCALRIGRIIPTVNVGSAKSREKMKAWIERWEAEKRKSGLFKVEGPTW